ncbi:MAG: ABC transporter permease [Roseateles sp.]|uniref:ABC transporter permease n=1 Tax=Roseateles sp. TaxID=1971397 RepID=UPI004036C29B
MSIVRRVAAEELRLMRRDRVAMLGLVLLLVLSAIAAFTAWEYQRGAQAERQHRQAQVAHELEAQPDRHPHRMVHYGHFVFRPLTALAAFDTGIDPFTGHTLFLEGHRQNSANFGDVRQSSLLLRFGQLTPAFVLQVLAPLLLVFIGHAAVARERESGTLRVLLAQGLRPGQLVAGKLLALSGVAALMLAPALLALAGIALGMPAQAGLALALGLAYAAWLAMWALGVATVSTLASRGRDALMALLALWTVSVVLLPRLAPEVAAATLALPTRLEIDIAVERDLAALGDSHNPDDPYFNEFRRKVLARYGVSRVEDLPVNYKGIVGMEGERLTSQLFDRYARESFTLQQAQVERLEFFSLPSPVIALRRLSMSIAGTDLSSYRRFLEQGEAHRYALIQALNRLQAEKLTWASDRNSRESRISKEHWHGLAEFKFVPEPPAEALRRAEPMAAVLLVWLGALGAALAFATRRLQGAMR